MHRAARHAVCGLAAAVLAALAAGGQTPSACPNSGLRHAARLPSSVHAARRWHRLRGGQDIDDPFVAETLAAVGLSRHAPAFEREGIHARNLPDLTADDLAELGLGPTEAANLLAHVAALRAEARDADKPGLDPVVADRLSVLGLGHHRATFVREGIAARNLADLNAKDLAELVDVCGVSSCL